MIINILNLPKRKDRRAESIRQMEMEGCAYMFWDGILGGTAKQNISQAHKQIIQHAKNNNIPSITVAEDDLCWTGSGAWKYYLENMPTDADIYVASYYSGHHDKNFVVSKFGGLTLYTCFQRYYDTFLALPETVHIDTAIAVSGARVIVSPMFVAIQSPGFSDQRKSFCDDSNKLTNKLLFGHGEK